MEFDEVDGEVSVKVNEEIVVDGSYPINFEVIEEGKQQSANYNVMIEVYGFRAVTNETTTEDEEENT